MSDVQSEKEEGLVETPITRWEHNSRSWSLLCWCVAGSTGRSTNSLHPSALLHLNDSLNQPLQVGSIPETVKELHRS